jgi:hypothetical protein
MKNTQKKKKSKQSVDNKYVAFVVDISMNEFKEKYECSWKKPSNQLTTKDLLPPVDWATSTK